MPFIHFDEAEAKARQIVKGWLDRRASPPRTLLLADLLGRLRLVLWDGPPDTADLDRDLASSCGPWWTGEVLGLPAARHPVYDVAWESARQDLDQAALRTMDRHRSRTAWFTDSSLPPWEAPDGGPPIVVFYSFKGGVGRSTLLASLAIQRARAGDRVCVLDFDLESPGVGTLLSADPTGLTARWGTVDLLLERSLDGLPLADYYHRCDRVAGPGQLLVFPAGRLDETYAGKLARIDLEDPPSAAESGPLQILKHLKELDPQWILVDARTGISEPAGHLLSGIAHLHVLLGTTNSQSWQGLRQVLDRLGRQRVLVDRVQAEVLLVQAMVPAPPAGKLARTSFASTAEAAFTDLYYAEAVDGEEDRLWDMNDFESQDAPHMSVPLDYEPKLAAFQDVGEVADDLCTGAYAAFAERVAGRFQSGGQD